MHYESYINRNIANKGRKCKEIKILNDSSEVFLKKKVGIF